MGDIKPQFKGNLGMFLVCAELSKRNLITMPTSRNTKGYDIVVLNPETNAAVGIQVKCTDRREFPILNSHWKDYKEKIKEKITSPFVFVDISDPDKPNYFIVSEEDLKSLLQSLIERYISDYGQKHGLSWGKMLEMERAGKRKPDLWVVRLSDIEVYKDRWETITNRLQRPGSLGTVVTSEKG